MAQDGRPAVRIDEDAATAGPTAQRHTWREGAALEFPGCRSATIRREDIETGEGRIEFRDAEPETAWMVREPTGAAHEQPSRRIVVLETLMRRFLASRGMPEPALRLDGRDLARATDEEVIDALLQCEDESDFRARLQGPRRRRG